ncbi:MAG: hypothetical protein R3C59_18170 [Planctomycetaceae bacterium]
MALVSEQRGRVRDLAGFRRSHQVPDECNDRTQSFIAKIAACDISDDLDMRFTEFRRHLKFKRIELKVTEPENGFGAISTPWFDYRITVTHCAEDVTEAIWRRQVTDFRNTSALLSSEFASVFGRLFNTVEFQCPESIDMEAFIDQMEDRNDPDLSVDYDRSSTWCSLTTSRIPGELSVQSDRIALITQQPQLPARLLEAFFQFREQLVGIEGFSTPSKG